MNDQINTRKLDHLRAIADDAGIERHASGFERVRLTHRALPEIDFDEIDTETAFLDKKLQFPLLISSMTGGEDEEIKIINRRLAEAAEECGVAMAVGSQRVMIANPAAAGSFDLRKYCPTIPLISNLGAVQLNHGFGLAECQTAIDALEADALYLHLNPLQEAVQPEGDLKFGGLADRIATLTYELNVPVLLKEVGSGLSAADIALGWNAGVRHFDVAGRGGTSWSRIEYHRRREEDDDIGLLFQDWGLTTVEALRQAAAELKRHPEPSTLIASGGMRSGIDMAKALVLGAQISGIAAPFLAAARVSTETVVASIQKLKREFRTAMFLLGCRNCDELIANESLLLGT
ncbi:MAG: type 2 isopentenyl-diphosphate Delta-isomerase [Pseudomonadota bacterium]